MKRILLLSLSLTLGISAFAQQRIAKNDIRQATASAKKVAVGKETVTPTATNFAPQTAKSIVVNRYGNLEDGETMMTTYDLQSNHFCSNRMYQLPDGSVAVAATMSTVVQVTTSTMTVNGALCLNPASKNSEQVGLPLPRGKTAKSCFATAIATWNAS